MHQKLRARLSSLRLRKKVTLVFAVILALIIVGVSVQQILMTNQLRFKDTQDSLSLVTEQVSINFSKNLREQEIRLYNAMSMFGLPTLIRSSQSDSNLRDTRLALNQMLTTPSPFDYLVVGTKFGDTLSAAALLTNSQGIAAEAATFLNVSEQGAYSGSEWRRSDSGGLYLARDIYDVSPLVYCGGIVAHVKNDVIFDLGERGQELEYTFLFFVPDKTGGESFLTAVGAGDPSLGHEIALLLQDGPLGRRVTIDGGSYFVSTAVHDSIRTVGLTPLRRVEDSNAVIMRSILLYGTVGLLVGIVVLLFSMRSLMRQLDRLTSAMDAMASGNLEQTVPVISTDDIGQLTAHFNNRAGKIPLLLERIVREQTLKTSAQFKLLEYRYRSLQTQLNPHFIFNALEAVNAMAKVDGNTELSRGILRISHYFRLITNNMNRQFLTVGEELESLEYYAGIHQSIQGRHLQVSFRCEEAAQGAVIPSMLLQPLLENAFVHGLRGASQLSAVSVSAWLETGRRVRIDIHDNGCGMTAEQSEQLLSGEVSSSGAHSGGVGLRNVRERLELLYGSDASIRIESEPGSTCVSVTLPLSYEDPLEFDIFDL